jgi:hypothetical protein
LSISAVFDSGFAESLGPRSRAIGASALACRFAETGEPHCDPLPTVEPRPTSAMHDALQFNLVFVRTPMHFEKRCAATVFCTDLYSSAPHPLFFKAIQI